MEHNTDIMNVIFATCNFYTLSKLRMHTETTLKLLEESITQYCTLIRRFKSHTCNHFEAKELPSEISKRARRQAAKQAKAAELGSAPAAKASKQPRPPPQFNLCRFKYHAIGYYPTEIRNFGTMESYSAMSVSNM